MKKVIPFCLALFTSLSAYASTPIERVMLINDLETWLEDGESLLNWSEFRHGKKVVESPNAYSLVKIYYDFRRNVFAAEKEYKGVIQRTRMPFSSVERNNRGEPIVIFDAGYANHIYANGLTVNEAEKLKVGSSVDLLCTGFKLDAYGNDMSITCSLLTDATKFTAVNNIQNESANSYIDKILSSKSGRIIKLIENNIDQNKISEFNSSCNFIDSINYSYCLKFSEELFFGVMKNPKVKESLKKAMISLKETK